MAWVTPDSSMITDHCGDTITGALPSLLPFNLGRTSSLTHAVDCPDFYPTVWTCDENHTHYVTFDLGQQRRITRLRGMLGSQTNITHVQVYVSSDNTSQGQPVLEVTDWQAYTKGEDDWETHTTRAKTGRYVTIAILSTIDPDNKLRWG